MSAGERGASAPAAAKGDPIKLTLVEARAGLAGTAERPLTVFTHIPKCAGTAFENILDAVARSQGRSVRRIRGSIYGQFLGEGKFANCERVLEPGAVPEIPEDVAFLTGHLPFGLHRQIPGGCLYVTLLREPGARCRSHFQHGVARAGWTADTPLADLFAAGALIDNPQVRQLAGLADPAAPCGEREVRQALDNLEQAYAVVGTQENFDDFLAAMIALYEWPAVCYGGGGPSSEDNGEDPPAGWRETLAAHHACDRELYVEIAGRQPLWRRDLECNPAAGRAGAARDVLMATPLPGSLGGEVLGRESFRRAVEAIRVQGGLKIVET